MPRQNEVDDDSDPDDIEMKPTGTAPTSDERMMAMFCHLGNLIGYLIVPLVIWLTQKDKSRFVDQHGKEAVNFCLTLLIAHAIAAVTVCITFGTLNVAIQIGGIIFQVVAGLAANRGEKYRYPLCIRLIT